jgi:hypothetical protein
MFDSFRTYPICCIHSFKPLGSHGICSTEIEIVSSEANLAITTITHHVPGHNCEKPRMELLISLAFDQPPQSRHRLLGLESDTLNRRCDCDPPVLFTLTQTICSAGESVPVAASSSPLSKVLSRQVPTFRVQLLRGQEIRRIEVAIPACH